MNEFFDPILFIRAGDSVPLQDPTRYPFLYNQGGIGRQLAEPRGRLIELAPEAPMLDIGSKYVDVEACPRIIESDSGTYAMTLFDFGVDEVHYMPFRATPMTAQAFGMTLLRNGDSIRFPYEGLVMADYSYGKWAGHQSPYLAEGRRRELLTFNPTDLEYHDFPHVFFSRDSLPLVVSVARFRPYAREIALADLWIDPGDAIVLPPKRRPPPPPAKCSPDEAWRIIVDLHGNRNSALACWYREGKAVLSTTTILANDELMRAEPTRPRYHEERSPTRHDPLGSQAYSQAPPISDREPSHD